jgi:hypothetical protein
MMWAARAVTGYDGVCASGVPWRGGMKQGRQGGMKLPGVCPRTVSCRSQYHAWSPCLCAHMHPQHTDCVALGTPPVAAAGHATPSRHALPPCSSSPHTQAPTPSLLVCRCRSCHTRRSPTTTPRPTTARNSWRCVATAAPRALGPPWGVVLQACWGAAPPAPHTPRVTPRVTPCPWVAAAAAAAGAAGRVQQPVQALCRPPRGSPVQAAGAPTHAAAAAAGRARRQRRLQQQQRRAAASVGRALLACCRPFRGRRAAGRR